MATETYPKDLVSSEFGHDPGGWKEGYGHRYPGKALPNKQDDRGMCIIKQSGQPGSAPGATYPKGRVGHERFPGLNGLP